MAEASKTVDFDIPHEKFWSIITDYTKYSEFVDGVSHVKVISQDQGKARVQYQIQLLGKDITYVLDHNENRPHEMIWTMVESNIFKSNNGGWKLKNLGGGRTEVTYSLALDFKIYVPGIVLKGLVKSSLPKMLDSFYKRAQR